MNAPANPCWLGRSPRRTLKGKEFDLLSGPDRYVILPPSKHANGQLYTWKRGLNEFVVLPQRLIDFAVKLKGRARLAGPTRSEFREGERNDAMFRAACALRLRLYDDGLLLETMRALNSTACKPPLSVRELETLVASSGRYENHKVAIFGPPSVTEPLPMEFLWYPYIIRYGITLLVGDPGRGKSLFAEYIAALVSSGGQLPLSDERLDPGRVLFVRRGRLGAHYAGATQKGRG